MKPSIFATTALAVATLASAGGVVAAPSTYDPDYAASVDQYENQRDAYSQAQDNYAASQSDYARQRSDYEAARRDYDRQYGYGSYERRYGVYDYQQDNSGRAYDRPGRVYSDAGCRDRRSSNGVGGGLIGGIAGAVIGSNVAARGNRTEGAIVGGVVGGLAGNAIGRGTVHCDGTGSYYGYSDTRPYDQRYSRGRYASDYYSSRQCRLVYGGDNRYVTVCPDRSGRYRIVG